MNSLKMDISDFSYLEINRMVALQYGMTLVSVQYVQPWRRTRDYTTCSLAAPGCLTNGGYKYWTEGKKLSFVIY